MIPSRKRQCSFPYQNRAKRFDAGLIPAIHAIPYIQSKTFLQRMILISSWPRLQLPLTSVSRSCLMAIPTTFPLQWRHTCRHSSSATIEPLQDTSSSPETPPGPVVRVVRKGMLQTPQSNWNSLRDIAVSFRGHQTVPQDYANSILSSLGIELEGNRNQPGPKSLLCFVGLKISADVTPSAKNQRCRRSRSKSEWHKCTACQK